MTAGEKSSRSSTTVMLQEARQGGHLRRGSCGMLYWTLKLRPVSCVDLCCVVLCCVKSSVSLYSNDSSAVVDVIYHNISFPINSKPF